MTEATRIHQEIMNLPLPQSYGLEASNRETRAAAAELAREAVAKLEAQILAITTDWPKTNARRAELIRRKVARTITDAEREELNRLQMFATARQCLFAPLPLEQLACHTGTASWLMLEQLTAIREALGMPDATVPEMCERIGELRRDSLGDVLNS